MKLFGSLITTSLIVAMVWGVALLQLKPSTAQAIETQNTTNSVVDKATAKKPVPAKISKPQVTKAGVLGNVAISISGVTERINLNDISSLWTKFEKASLLHQRLIKQPKKVYVYYRKLSDDYKTADVTIGYNSELISPSSNNEVIPNAKYHTLLANGVHSEQEIANTWQKIDYQQSNISVVEVHYLASGSVEVSVSYK